MSREIKRKLLQRMVPNLPLMHWECETAPDRVWTLRLRFMRHRHRVIRTNGDYPPPHRRD